MLLHLEITYMLELVQLLVKVTENIFIFRELVAKLYDSCKKSILKH